eukprot:2859210-Rhodomonas_salina.1
MRQTVLQSSVLGASFARSRLSKEPGSSIAYVSTAHRIGPGSILAYVSTAYRIGPGSSIAHVSTTHRTAYVNAAHRIARRCSSIANIISADHKSSSTSCCSLCQYHTASW